MKTKKLIVTCVKRLKTCMKRPAAANLRDVAPPPTKPKVETPPQPVRKRPAAEQVKEEQDDDEDDEKAGNESEDSGKDWMCDVPMQSVFDTSALDVPDV